MNPGTCWVQKWKPFIPAPFSLQIQQFFPYTGPLRAKPFSLCLLAVQVQSERKHRGNLPIAGGWRKLHIFSSRRLGVIPQPCFLPQTQKSRSEAQNPEPMILKLTAAPESAALDPALDTTRSWLDMRNLSHVGMGSCTCLGESIGRISFQEAAPGCSRSY